MKKNKDLDLFYIKHYGGILLYLIGCILFIWLLTWSSIKWSWIYSLHSVWGCHFLPQRDVSIPHILWCLLVKSMWSISSLLIVDSVLTNIGSFREFIVVMLRYNIVQDTSNGRLLQQLGRNMEYFVSRFVDITEITDGRTIISTNSYRTFTYCMVSFQRNITPIS